MSRTCEVHAAGHDAIVVRRGTGAEDAAHLRDTGERLAAAAHPGVVEVVRSSGADDLWELELVYGGRPVDLAGPLSVERVAGVAAAVAATLADLHAAGIVHGRVEASHVLLGPQGRPVLCGFGPAVGEAARREDDVAAVGALIVALLGVDADIEPIPDRRWRGRRAWAGWSRRSLLLIADHACAEPPTRRPSAARLAAAIADAVPGAAATATLDSTDRGSRLPPRERAAVSDPIATSRPTVRDEASARLPALACAVLGVLVLGAGALRLAQPVASQRPTVTSSVPQSNRGDAAPPSALEPTDRPPTTTSHHDPAAMCSAAGSSSPDCVGSITVEGTTVVVGGRRYEVGQPGDFVVVGDWDGDRVPTAALLRPGTGDVFVFSSWTSGEDVVVHPTATVNGAVELVVAPALGRDQLVARRADGTERPVDTTGAA